MTDQDDDDGIGPRAPYKITVSKELGDKLVARMGMEGDAAVLSATLATLGYMERLNAVQCLLTLQLLGDFLGLFVEQAAERDWRMAGSPTRKRMRKRLRELRRAVPGPGSRSGGSTSGSCSRTGGAS